VYIKHGVGIHYRTFITTHPLEKYYLNQAGRGLPSAKGIGPIYAASIYLQRGNGIGSFFVPLYRFVRPLLWTVGRTVEKIISDIAHNKSPDMSAENIISKHVREAGTEYTRRLVSKLLGRDIKRGAKTPKRRGGKKPKPAKRARVIKRDIFSSS